MVTESGISLKAFTDTIRKHPLFDGLSDKELSFLLEPDSCILGNYRKGAVIVQEGEACHAVGFVISGGLCAQLLSHAGGIIKMRMFVKGDCFGQGLLFMPRQRYPYTIVANDRASVLYVPYEGFRQVMDSSIRFNQNLISSLCESMEILMDKVRILSRADVRSRLILYLGKEMRRANSAIIDLPHTKADIAALLGVARPSVPRELGRMQRDGLIEVRNRRVLIKQTDSFASLQ